MPGDPKPQAETDAEEAHNKPKIFGFNILDTHSPFLYIQSAPKRILFNGEER